MIGLGRPSPSLSPGLLEGGSHGTKLASHPEGIAQLEYLPSTYKALAFISSIGS